jgi:hypothetical protein
MARKLLWAGYPTDYRGSYFRQFWDVSRYVRQPGDPADPDALAELLKDIPPIHTWPLPAPLGDHENRADIVPNNVVLIIRGELLRRYPDAIIYAAKAKVEEGKRIIDTSDERFPIFGGEIPTDITFLGCNLSRRQRRPTRARFFFVFSSTDRPARARAYGRLRGQLGHSAWTTLRISPGGSITATPPARTFAGRDGAAPAFR